METIEVSEYVDNLLQEDTSTNALEQIIIKEAQKLEAKGKARDKMEEPSDTSSNNRGHWRPWLRSAESQDPFERRLRSQTTLRRTGYYGIAPISFGILDETKERVRNARRQLFKASGKEKL